LVEFSLGSFLAKEKNMPNKETKNKHLTFDDRTEIQECLNRGMTFKAIARRIGKDPTTVSKEVKKHMELRDTSVKFTDAEGREESKVCPSLLRAPFVCNPCRKRFRCPFPKRYYNAKLAHAQYRSLLHEAREGIPLGKESFILPSHK
jgi:hypothetical protein